MIASTRRGKGCGRSSAAIYFAHSALLFFFLIARILFIPELIGFAQYAIPHNFLNTLGKECVFDNCVGIFFFLEKNAQVMASDMIEHIGAAMYLYIPAAPTPIFSFFFKFLEELCVRATVSLVLQYLVLEVRLKVKD